MASDITLAVGDGARRMTYAELAAVRGISPASAKRLAQRHRWGRQVGNDGVTRVTAPLSALVNTASVAGDVIGDVAPAVIPVTEPLDRAVDALREQLGIANRRIDELQRRIDGLHTDLADARTAAMISGCEAAVLRTRLELLTDRRPWWRRWFR